jgi:hypothetical protein
MIHTIEIIAAGRVKFALSDSRSQDAAEAIQWAYFWLGWYRADAARVYRGDVANPENVAGEIVPPADWLAAQSTRLAEANGYFGPLRRSDDLVMFDGEPG